MFEVAIKHGYMHAASDDELYRIYTDLILKNAQIFEQVQETARPIAGKVAESLFRNIENIVPWLNPVA